MNNFKQWIIDNYSHNEMADMANHGCTGGVSGMIYYPETEAIYKKFSHELHEILDDYRDQVGEWPDYVTKELGHFQSFSNAVLWFCAEFVSQELTQGIYEDEIA
jgi:hypothetical protein